MATLGDPIAENLQLSEDPDSGRIEYVIRYPVYDLTPSAQPMDLIVQAFGLMPARGAPGPIPGTFVIQRTPEPWPPNDCFIDVRYASPQYGDRVGDAPRISGSTSLDQGSTDFDAANLAIPFASRKPIEVPYEANLTTPSSTAPKQGATAPILLPKSVITYTRRVNYDPSAESRAYTGKTNSDTFRGCPPDTLIVLEIPFDSDDGGITYREAVSMAYDPDTKFKQVVRWVDPATGKPPSLTPAQVAAGNGIKEVTVQGRAAFAGLHLT